MILQLKEENKVYLFIKNLKKKKTDKKFNYVKVGPFFIRAKKKTISYKLDLPKYTKIYSVFYCLLLELVDPKIPILDMYYYKVQKKNKFKVIKILDPKS